jgi:hypothetical protein
VRTSVLIGLVCLFVYNANLRSISAGDAYPARYMPFGLLRYGSLSLDPILPLVRQGQTPAYWIQKGRGDRAISLYPVVLPIVVSPLYVPAALYLQVHGWPADATDRAARIMEKLSASLLAATTSALLFLLLRRRASPSVALLLTLAFAFGTTTWMISSQALWQHGLAELLLVSALLLVTGPATMGRVIAAGAMLGLAAGNRPPDAILAAALTFHALYWAGRRAPWLVVAGAVPAALVLAYNLAFAGHWAGGYGLVGKTRFFSRNSLLPGMAGLLFSPTHGLFVFSPFLLAVPLAVRRLWADVEHRRLVVAMAAAMAMQLLLYAKADWTGGASFGPRWLTDLLPFLFWMLAPIVMSLRRPARIVFACACSVAIGIEAVGAFWYMNASDSVVATASNRQQAQWDVRNAPFLLELRHPPAPTMLWGSRRDCHATDLQGNLDVLRTTIIGPEILPAESDMRAEGWTLVGQQTPSDVTVTLDDRVVGSTRRFFTRPDVVHAIRNTHEAGWTVDVSGAGVAAGEHVLRVLARSCPDSPPRVLLTRAIVTTAPPPVPVAGAGDGSLRSLAARAAELLGRDQSSLGFWLTPFTKAPRFERPSLEMNTFLTSLLVDVLEPVATDAHVTDALGRARAHLTAQIEDDGLVRYHGLPNGPGIGTLGCAISPDADDTALVWRIAPKTTPALLRRAVATLGQYRTSDGLYRTWLAPPDRYECLDPGRDPNPADLVIQMHVLMLLAQADPPAARALCAALAPVVNEDRVWAYYRMTPIVPIFRQSDLEKAGCSVTLPASRLRVSVASQDDWTAAATLLHRFAGRGQTPPTSTETSALLRTLAADDFARVRASPPLLFHNDLTATTPRYYWSQDAGYALWLRLYFESARRDRVDGGSDSQVRPGAKR